jgi:hypothetical protein
VTDLSPLHEIRVDWLHGPIHDWVLVPDWLHARMHAEDYPHEHRPRDPGGAR